MREERVTLLMEQIKRVKEALGLNNQDFANITGRDRSSIKRYFDGDIPPLDIFIKMADFVGLSVFLDMKEHPKEVIDRIVEYRENKKTKIF